MKQNMIDKKRKLKPGEIIPIYYDEAFKMMYANPKHLEILTLLLSRILKVDYRDIEGKISLNPLSIPKRTLGEKKTERDVVVTLKGILKTKIILEVNVKPKFYQSIINRNILYKNEVASSGIVENEDYKNIPLTFLVNFNTFFINNERRKVFDKFMLRNEEGDILTDKEIVLNINIVECKKLWYHNKYQGKFEPYEEDLLLLCAAMVVNKQVDFLEILENVRTRPEIKDLMEGVLAEMISDEEMYGRYYNWKEEQDKINKSIISEEREDAIAQAKKEIVINMYKNELTIDTIANCTNLSPEKIKEILVETTKD